MRLYIPVKMGLLMSFYMNVKYIRTNSVDETRINQSGLTCEQISSSVF